jgi:DNA-binding transcriptional regulator YhcF (GntR family)
MDFNDKQIIYLQIADYVNDHILLGKWKEEDKIPSVRDLAVLLQVNPNTVMRAYEMLQQKGIIYNKRGLGNYVAANAGRMISSLRREQFLNNELPHLFRTIYTLGIPFEEMEQMYKRYVMKNYKNK